MQDFDPMTAVVLKRTVTGIDSLTREHQRLEEGAVGNIIDFSPDSRGCLLVELPHPADTEVIQMRVHQDALQGLIETDADEAEVPTTVLIGVFGGADRIALSITGLDGNIYPLGKVFLPSGSFFAAGASVYSICLFLDEMSKDGHRLLVEKGIAGDECELWFGNWRLRGNMQKYSPLGSAGSGQPPRPRIRFELKGVVEKTI
jgi:hypothetical protein